MQHDHRSDADYEADVRQRRDEMERALRAPGPGGWLAIVGMYPLAQGENTVGAAPGSTVLLPAGAAPERLGVIDFADTQGTLRVATDEPVFVDEVETRHAVLRNHYAPGGMSVVRVRDVRFGIMQWASDPYNVRVWDANSPKRLSFPGRAWYPIARENAVIGRFTPHPPGSTMVVTHTGGETQVLANPGRVAFSLRGQDFVFEASTPEQGESVVWLLLRDGTNGRTTYGAGRFLMAPRLDGDRVLLDFNLLYLPPCAFCDYTTCPMPPRANVLPFPLEAGERFPEQPA